MNRLRDALLRIERVRSKTAGALSGQPTATRQLRSRHLWKLSLTARSARRDNS